MAAIQSSMVGLVSGEPEKTDAARPFTLAMLEAALRDQADLTAVERFAQRHENEDLHLRARLYTDLLPASPPGPGEQYAFEVDLDACTGCKACVTACHSLNGLDEGESFRSVGLLHGGSTIAPFQQTVTTACHHCVDPACMTGCPVNAYEKDPVTGIVRHLDDQCIGCQYCTLTCPYEVPRYHAAKGIVRKCDMCHERLAVGEAPACVQGCPNEAIAIRVVSRDEVARAAEGEAFLPGAPEPSITLPTTTFKTERAIPRNVLGADHFTVRPAHSHGPLVAMLVLTQLSAGAFVADRVLAWLGGARLSAALSPFHAWFGLVVGLVALASSVLHLGRPKYAFRAILGLRTSWLSREILAFGGFAGAATLHAVLASGVGERFGVHVGASTREAAGASVAVMGALGVYTSVMVYAVTRKQLWSLPRTAMRFFGTSAVLGTSASLFAASLVAWRLGTHASVPELASWIGKVAWALVLATIAKLAFEASHLVHLRDRSLTELKGTALLLAGALRDETMSRFALGFLGGVIVPLAFVRPYRTASPGASATWAAIALFSLVAGELLERSSFFRAVRAPRMPGGLDG